MAQPKELYANNIQTPMFRMAWPYLFEKRPGYKNGPAHYALDMLFNKDSKIIAPIEEAIEELMKKRWGKNRPDGLHSPIKDGDDPKKAKFTGFAGHWVLTAKKLDEKTELKVVDRMIDPETGKLRVITDSREIYGGCWGKASITLATYSQGTGGVTCYLNHVQKIKDDKAFSGRQNPDDIFAPIEEFKASDISDEAIASVDDF